MSRPGRRTGAAARRAPVAWGRAFGQPASVLLSYELGGPRSLDEETFPSAEFYGYMVTDVLGPTCSASTRRAPPQPRPVIAGLPPATHARVIGPLLEPVAHELIDRFEGGRRSRTRGRFPPPLHVRVDHAPVGPPRHSEDRSRSGPSPCRHPAALRLRLQCSHEFMAFVDPISSNAGTSPGDDLISTLATAEVDGERRTDEEISTLRCCSPPGPTQYWAGQLVVGLTAPPISSNGWLPTRAECHWRREGVRWYPPRTWIPRRNPREVVWHDVAIPRRADAAGGLGPTAIRPSTTTPTPSTHPPAAGSMTFGFGPTAASGPTWPGRDGDVAAGDPRAPPPDPLDGGDDVRVTAPSTRSCRVRTGCRSFRLIRSRLTRITGGFS